MLLQVIRDNQPVPALVSDFSSLVLSKLFRRSQWLSRSFRAADKSICHLPREGVEQRCTRPKLPFLDDYPLLLSIANRLKIKEPGASLRPMA